MDEKIAIMTVLVSLIVGAVTILKAGLEHFKRSKTERLQFDLYDKVLDKSGSHQEVMATILGLSAASVYWLAWPKR